MDLSTYIDITEDKLVNSFDVSRDFKIDGFDYDLFANYNIRNERFLLIRKAVIYAFENNEYILMKAYKSLDKNDYNEFTDNLIKSISVIVNPSREHMSSAITGVILVENIFEEDFDYIKKSIKKFKYNRGFAFGFKGWVDLRLILISIKDGIISVNKKGKEVASFYNLNSS